MNQAELDAAIEQANQIFSRQYKLGHESPQNPEPSTSRRRKVDWSLASADSQRGDLRAVPVVPADAEPFSVAMPPGLRLIRWNLKEPPVAIDVCSIVTAPTLFAYRTLEQLRTALAEPKRWFGWSVPQLIDRLAQVGVLVAIESKAAVHRDE